MKVVIQNSSTNYKRKLMKSLGNEISVADYASLPNELLSYDDSSFLLETDITYSNIEEVFTSAAYYNSMKKLTDNEKMVLFLIAVEGKTTEEIAEIMNTTRANIWKIKSRAKMNFLKNLPNDERNLIGGDLKYRR